MSHNNLLHTVQQQQIEAFIMIFLGSISVLVALFFLKIIKYSFFKGMAAPLLVFGAIEIIAFTMSFDYGKKNLLNATLLSTLLLLNTIAFIYFTHKKIPFWKGFSMGLIIKISVLLLLSLFL